MELYDIGKLVVQNSKERALDEWYKAECDVMTYLGIERIAS